MGTVVFMVGVAHEDAADDQRGPVEERVVCAGGHGIEAGGGVGVQGGVVRGDGGQGDAVVEDKDGLGRQAQFGFRFGRQAGGGVECGGGRDEVRHRGVGGHQRHQLVDPGQRGIFAVLVQGGGRSQPRGSRTGGAAVRRRPARAAVRW
ncbi:hypothetical protein [Streptomyces sp. KN37]|uniref:hypothetical protein n=1 Tax=Streptomyces sp. KN37 TaxID=3090667 RepID=UPI002A74C917|nr:hypothetical protein [Streptomyces sp. KN37]WPO76732.1 hypothetical protein R9806_39610 [Streptomyces sp. KN37]